MSINPLRTLEDSDVENYDPDMHGPRLFPVVNTENNIEFVRGIHNVKLNPYLIDFNTLEFGKIRPKGVLGAVQNIAVEIKYRDPNGKSHRQWFPFERYDIRQILLPLLKGEDYWLLLPCKEYSDAGLLMALSEIGIQMTLEDVEFIQLSKGHYLMEAKPKSLGWFGETYIKLV